MLEGIYYDGDRPVRVEATMTTEVTDAIISTAEGTKKFVMTSLLVSPRVGSAPRFIALPDGGQFQCEDQTFLDALPQEVWSEGLVALLEKHVWAAVLSAIVTTIIMFTGYFFGLPAAAEKVAERIPIETEIALGDEIMRRLDNSTWFDTALIDKEKKASVLREFKDLCRGLPMERHYRLEFRSSEKIGANAFALPGGTIIVTEQMIRKAEADEEILAVLAHEIGHVEHRHVLRQLLQGSVIGVTVTAITSDAASLGTVFTGVPVVLLSTKYSRAFEIEADVFAFGLLRENNISPLAFANLMRRLSGDNNELGFLSTHPLTSERIEHSLKAASSND